MTHTSFQRAAVTILPLSRYRLHTIYYFHFKQNRLQYTGTASPRTRLPSTCLSPLPFPFFLNIMLADFDDFFILWLQQCQEIIAKTLFSAGCVWLFFVLILSMHRGLIIILKSHLHSIALISFHYIIISLHIIYDEVALRHYVLHRRQH